MFDKKITPIYQSLLNPIGNFLIKKKVNADTLTIIGFIFGICTLPLLIMGYFYCALLFIFLNRTFDGLDGIVARKTVSTDRGAFLDFTLDCVFYSLIPIGFALHDLKDNATASLFLLGSFIGTSVSFLSMSIITERKGLYCKDKEGKGFYYDSSLVEGTETIVFFVIICLFPTHYKFFAYIFTAGCLITLIMRLRTAWIVFSNG